MGSRAVFQTAFVPPVYPNTTQLLTSKYAETPPYSSRTGGKRRAGFNQCGGLILCCYSPTGDHWLYLDRYKKIKHTVSVIF